MNVGYRMRVLIWKDQSLSSSPGGYAVTVPPEMYPLLALIAALGLLILTAACITLGSLLLAKGAARDREISIRSAIGASRGRLFRQLLTESVALAALGSAAGILLGYITLRGLLLLTDTPPSLNPAPDWHVAVFSLSAGLIATLLFGLAPAVQVARQRQVTASGAQILFVGLSTPKQDKWMFAHRNSFGGVTMIGVGAAFDFIAGRRRQAPPWMQRNGLEWLFRLMVEPVRLGRRYLWITPRFLPLWLGQWISFKRKAL